MKEDSIFVWCDVWLYGALLRPMLCIMCVEWVLLKVTIRAQGRERIETKREKREHGNADGNGDEQTLTVPSPLAVKRYPSHCPHFMSNTAP
jgi:hypothetical protein